MSRIAALPVLPSTYIHHRGSGSGVSDTLMNVADPAPVREQVAAVASQLWESALPAHEVPHRSRFPEEPLTTSMWKESAGHTIMSAWLFGVCSG